MINKISRIGGSSASGEDYSTLEAIRKLLGSDEGLLDYKAKGISSERLTIPGPNFVSQVFSQSDRSDRVIENLQSMFNHGDLATTGYLSILPVDQGIEHSAGSAFAPNPDYFDPENIVRLAVEAGCNAVASTYGALALVARRYAHKIPFIVKLNHNEFMSYPNAYDQVFFTQVKAAWDMGAKGVGATIYFGSPESRKQLVEVSAAFKEAHDRGMFTVLWCYTRNPAFKTTEKDYHTAADLTGQANHLGATIGADILKQKMPTNNGAFKALKFGKTDERIYGELVPDHPIEWVRYQVACGYMGKIGLINSGGESGKSDLADAVKTAVINKRAGGMGLICGRKAFQKPFDEGVDILRAIQGVYKCEGVGIA